MSKQELKLQYKTGKLTAKEYFLALGQIIKSEMPVDHFKDVTKKVYDDDLLKIFDGGLPLFATTKPTL